MSDSLMYRLCYYRFAEASERNTGRRGYDRVRNADIGLMDFKCVRQLACWGFLKRVSPRG